MGKRRKRKWPLFLVFIGLGIGIYHFWPKSKAQPTLSTAYHPVTWSQFSDHKRLQMLLKGFAIEGIIDIPCMDFSNFSKSSLRDVRYIGIFSSKDEAQAMQAQFGSKKRTFLHREIPIDTLPKADLILCWDKLCTMSFNDVRSSILQFKKSGAHFLLMRHFPEIKENHKNTTNGMHPVNWTLEPYNFPEPIIHIMEKGEYGMESLALWNLEAL